MNGDGPNVVPQSEQFRVPAVLGALRLDHDGASGSGVLGVPPEIPDGLPQNADAPQLPFHHRPPSDTLIDHPIPRQNGAGMTMNGTLTTQDAMALVNSRARPHRVWKKRHAKLLVVGDAGLGKTTLIRTLLSVPGHNLIMHDGAETTMHQFQKDPDALCHRLVWKDEEERIEWSYAVQDTPGYGDRVNVQKSIDMMVAFVSKQNEKWFNLETSRRRPADLSTVDDPRIDVCLFCLPPHRLRYIDVRYMYELGKVVAVIPVVTKADTMNVREATIYRQEVHSKLQNLAQFGLPGRIGLFEFEKETLERAGVDPPRTQFQSLPFLVVASNDVNYDYEQRDVFWPERQYAWGTCEAFNPEHSDMVHLRLLLVKEGLEEISAAKLERYEVWRRKRMTRMKMGVPAKAIILASTAVVAWGMGSSVATGMSIRRVLLATGSVLFRTFGPKNRDRVVISIDPPSPPPPPHTITPAMFGQILTMRG